MSTDRAEDKAEGAKVSRLISGGGAKRIAVALAVVAIAAVAYSQYGRHLSLENLVRHETALRAYQEQSPILALSIAFLIYVAVTGLSLPGATVLSLLFAWYFGFARAMILVSFASTTGASIAFLMSRFVFRDVVQRAFGDRLASFNAALEKEGATYLFTLRLIPLAPFFVINAVMGLTPIKLQTFWWVSQLGMLPGTAAYIWAGSSVPDLKTLAERGAEGILSWQLALALVVLGLTPWVLRKAVAGITKLAQ